MNEASRDYVLQIIEYSIRKKVSTEVVVLLPQKFLPIIVKKIIARLKKRSQEKVDDLLDNNNYEDYHLQQDALDKETSKMDLFLLDLLRELPFSAKFDILTKLTEAQMNKLFSSVIVSTYDPVEERYDDLSKPFFVVLGEFTNTDGTGKKAHANYEYREKFDATIGSFVEDIVNNWSIEKIRSFVNFAMVYPGLGYDTDYETRNSLMVTIVQNLPIEQIKLLMGKDDSLQIHQFLSVEQKFDMRTTKSDKLTNIKRAIVEFDRNPDVSKLNEKESVELLTLLTN